MESQPIIITILLTTSCQSPDLSHLQVPSPPSPLQRSHPPRREITLVSLGGSPVSLGGPYYPLYLGGPTFSLSEVPLSPSEDPFVSLGGPHLLSPGGLLVSFKEHVISLGGPTFSRPVVSLSRSENTLSLSEDPPSPLGGPPVFFGEHVVSLGGPTFSRPEVSLSPSVDT
jgi:hypothetical protein